MRTLVKKWGNSASVRIPSAVMEAAHLRLNDPVDVREVNGHIIIEPIRPPDYNLEQLVSAITNENLHDVVDFGNAVGKEAF